MSLKDFKIVKMLGKGAFGRVDLVVRKEDGKIYAMKSVKISQLSTKEQENALNEVRVLASISHPNIIGYKEAFFDTESKSLNIVMEYADDGDLESKLKNHINNKTNFPENEIWSYLIQMIEGLKALHDIKTMHRDLKSANVFVMKNGILKLGDLNVSKVVKMGLVYTQTGTPYYASPEVWADKPYDYKSDIWSVGCVIYELCNLKPPFRGANLEQLYQSVTKGVYEPIPKIYSNDLHRIVALLLQTNPNNRPNCESLLSNPIILKRIDFTKNVGYECSNELLNTIKLPRNINEINQKLPKTKKYVEPSGLTMLKTKNMDKVTVEEEINPIMNDYNNRKMYHHREAENAIKKDNLSRPSSSKNDQRSKTPAVVSNRRNIQSAHQNSNVSTNTNSQNSSNQNLVNQNNPNNRNKIPVTNLLNNNSNHNINANYYSNQNVKSNINGINAINSGNNVLNNQIVKPTRASSAKPTNSRLTPGVSKEPPISIKKSNVPTNNNQNQIRSASHGKVLNNNINADIKQNQYEYIPSNKNNNPILRPSSSRDKIQHSYHSNNNTPIIITQNSKQKLINENYQINSDHKVLVQPVKIVENPAKREFLNNGNQQNNFLKGASRPQNNEYNVGIKIAQSNPKMINLYRK